MKRTPKGSTAIHPIRGLILAGLMAAGLFPGMEAGSRARDEASGGVAELRNRLDEIERERTLAPLGDIPWKQTAAPGRIQNNPKFAEIHLVSESRSQSCVWRFRPLDDPNKEEVRDCIRLEGEDWFWLHPGRWELTLRAGGGNGNEVMLAPKEVLLRAGAAYESFFDTKAQQIVDRKLRALKKNQSKDSETGTEADRKTR